MASTVKQRENTPAPQDPTPAPEAAGGIASIAPQNPPAQEQATTPEAAGVIASIPIGRIDADRNIRASLGDLSEMADSIREVGVLQPITVVPKGDDRYEVVFGHRRLAAAELAELAEVPAIVRAPVEEPERVTAMIVENLHREDLTPLEEARAYQTLVGLKLSQRAIAKKVGTSQANVSKRLSLLTLTPQAIDALDSGRISVEDALHLAKLADQPSAIHQVLEQRLNGSSSYLTTEAMVQNQLNRIAQEKKRADALALLGERGTTVVKDGNWYHRPEKIIGAGYGQLNVDPIAHNSEPCHAATVDGAGEIRPVCTNPAAHLPAPEVTAPSDSDPSLPGADDPASPQNPAPDPLIGSSPLKVAPPPQLTAKEEEARRLQEADEDKRRERRERWEAEEAQRAQLRAEAEAAREARETAMRGLLEGKLARGKTVDVILRQLLGAALQEFGELQVCMLLGLEPCDPEGWPLNEDEPFAVEVYADGGGDKLLRAALAAALAVGEPSASELLPDALRRPNVQRHYRFLQGIGYEPGEAEAAVLTAIANGEDPDDEGGKD